MLRSSFSASAVSIAVGSLFLLSIPCGAQSIQWARQFGTGSVDEAFAVAAAPGVVYVAGETVNGSFVGGTSAGARDAFVSKFDAEGNHLWTRQFGTSDEDTATALAADASGVYVVGHTGGALQGTNLGSTDAFVRKYDPNGNELWTRQFGTSNPDEALGAAVDGTGFYVGGRTSGALPGQTSGSLGQDDVFLRKYSPDGNEVWTRQFGTTSGDRGWAVAADTSGVYIAGETGGPLVSQAAGTDAFVRKYDANGTAAWTRQISSGGNQADIAYGVAVNSAGVFVSGDTVGTFTGQAKVGGLYDAWAAKLDLNGTVQWTRQIGTSDEDSPAAIAATARWVYVSLGSNGRVLVLRLDQNGGAAGVVQNTVDRNFGYAVAVDGAAAYLAGSKDGSSLGQTPQGDLDALLLKIPHPPEVTGVSDAFNGQPGVAPTTWIALYGTGLSTTTRTWDGAIQGTQLPTTLDGVSVSINGRPATMYFVSPGQVNVIGPLDDASGNVSVTLTNAYGTSAPLQVPKGQVLPAFYAPFGEAKGLMVTAVALDGTLVGKPGIDPRVTRPARPGELVQFFASGFGPTNPPAASNLLFAGAPELVTRPRITIGGRDAAITGNGNLVGPGLYQFNLTIPDLSDGDHIIQAEIGAVRSRNTVFLTVGR